jgi:uncharacterized protein with NRDE domain
MCLIIFAWQLDPMRPLIVAANRDEFHARPARPFAAWSDLPGVHAGRDLEAGGTWMGVGLENRFAALTNIRDPKQIAGARSRGELVAAYLAGSISPSTYLQSVTDRLDKYAGFNLLVGDGRELWHLNSGSALPQRLAPGLYGLCNADLDTPWPKVERSKAAFMQALDAQDPEPMFNLLGDRHVPRDAELPGTGVPLETERLLASAFIVSPRYGTRTSTLLIQDAGGLCTVEERTFDPDGSLSARITWQR